MLAQIMFAVRRYYKPRSSSASDLDAQKLAEVLVVVVVVVE